MRMHQRLAQLNAMSPQQRERTVEHNEAMERLTPVQRSEVRGAMEQLGSLPLGERQQVMRSFRALRMLPPNQRMAVMMSSQFGWLNPAQRTVLTNLIQIAPMLPPE
jgi:DNA-directed RNA polymerase specialized sigma24 family protein